MGKYIGTISRSEWGWGAIKRVLERLDIKEYVVGEETGESGYEHFQFAIDTSGDLVEYVHRNNCGWHVEICNDWENSKKYCRKDGRVHEYSDTLEFREYIRIRDRKLRDVQLSILESLQNQNDRAITVWIDRKGSSGKSTLLYLMARRGEILPIPRSEQSASNIIDFVGMHYKGEPIICLDLARKVKLTDKQCEALEDVKDGLISSSKYQGVSKFLKGVKILVYTNQWIERSVYKALTEDRWDVHVIGDEKEEEESTPL